MRSLTILWDIFAGCSTQVICPPAIETFCHSLHLHSVQVSLAFKGCGHDLRFQKIDRTIIKSFYRTIRNLAGKTLAFVNIGPLAVHLHKFRGWKGPSKDVKRLEATLKSTKRFELQLNPAGRAVNDNAGCSPQQTCRSVQFTMRTYEIKNSMGTILELLSGFVFWTNSPSQG